jgi:alkylation response protein AidB-like acyl-CoA dehydrogenase
VGVDVGFDDSQLELRAAVRDVLERECPPSVVREALSDPERWRPLWKTVTDLGWTGLALLDDEAGFGVIELIAVLEEVGAAAAPIPLLSSAGFAAGVLRAAGPDAGPWQQRLAEGVVGALGVAAPGARGFDPVLTYADGRVRGVVGGVADAARAEMLVLLAASANGSVVAAVVPPGDGVRVSTADAVDPGRPVATLTVDATVEAAFPIPLPAALSLPMTAAAAELVGLAGRSLDVAVTHARTREQFGKPIGAFQGMKHPLADCYVAIERARGLTYAAAMQLTDPDASPVDTWRAALLAKAAAGEAATETARLGVRVHGALGMTWEHDMHLYLRRAWQSATVLGDQRTLYRLAASSAVGRS